jgi:hypothetical protein
MWSNIWQTKIKKILKSLIISVLGLVVVTQTYESSNFLIAINFYMTINA